MAKKNLTQEEIEARIKAFEDQMNEFKNHREPVSSYGRTILNIMSIEAERGKGLTVLNKGQSTIKQNGEITIPTQPTRREENKESDR